MEGGGDAVCSSKSIILPRQARDKHTREKLKNGRSCLAGAAIKKTNDFYGGLSYTGERVIFVNGDIDPWHKLSLNQGETSPRNDKVRKRSFPTFPVFLTKQKLTMIIYQDRLGTNIEKTQK